MIDHMAMLLLIVAAEPMLDAALTDPPVTHSGLLCFLFCFVLFFVSVAFFLGTFLSSLSIYSTSCSRFFFIYLFLSFPLFSFCFL